MTRRMEARLFAPFATGLAGVVWFAGAWAGKKKNQGA
jgi:hypothetical protein